MWDWTIEAARHRYSLLAEMKCRRADNLFFPASLFEYEEQSFQAFRAPTKIGQSAPGFTFSPTHTMIGRFNNAHFREQGE